MMSRMTSRMMSRTKAATTASLFTATFTAAAVMLGSVQLAAADPCGMVPPMQMVERTALTRIGVQKTFVSYHQGVETMVLRPGFSGKVDEFGMLIPFPSPPAIRKVDDNIFGHIAAAIDPPEVVAYVRRYLSRGRLGGMPSAAAPEMDEDVAGDKKLEVNTVRVVKREAVGMYDVAVLEAGSARALQRWMDDHGFRYPDGMGGVVQEYVDIRWYFVAVKTQVGSKDQVNPRPGMRQADARLPKGSSFDGHVQAMGFRFRTDEFVVPMRLSTFNPGETRNVVYVLTDSPQRIDDIPRRHVMRQISGRQLYDNLTRPLPLRVIGGSYQDLAPWQKKGLKAQRDPTPHNGKAKELFASDLLAVDRGRLANPVEEREKALLAIGEELDLRGPAIDKLNDQELQRARDRAVRQALRGLRRMTLTVIDGDFDREVLARQNLTFSPYRMAAQRNNRSSYDARTLGPVGAMPGNVYTGALLDDSDGPDTGNDPDGGFARPPQTERRAAAGSLRLTGSANHELGATGAGLVLFMLLVASRRRRLYTRPGTRWMGSITALALGVAITGLIAGGTGAAWGDPVKVKGIPTYKVHDDGQDSSPAAQPGYRGSRAHRVSRLIVTLSDTERAGHAVTELVAIGRPAIEPLLDEVWDSRDTVRQGWAIVALTRIGQKEGGTRGEVIRRRSARKRIDRALRRIHQNKRQSTLVRTWAGAGRIELVRSYRELDALGSMVSQLPALGRPLALRTLALIDEVDGPEAAEALLTAMSRHPQMRAEFQPAILAASSRSLVRAMIHGKDQNIRRTAASYLGTVAGQGRKDVARSVIAALRFRKGAERVPWHDGALFLPALSWSRKDARALVGQLIRWHLWAEIDGNKAAQNNLHNNLRSLGLARVAGYQSPGWSSASTVQWLTVWRAAVGRDAIEAILVEQGAERDPTYRALLAGN